MAARKKKAAKKAARKRSSNQAGTSDGFKRRADGTLLPGQKSLNPTGRPKSNFRHHLYRILQEPFDPKHHDGITEEDAAWFVEQGMTNEEVIAHQLMRQMASGDLPATKELLAREIPAVQKVEVDDKRPDAVDVEDTGKQRKQLGKLVGHVAPSSKKPTHEGSEKLQ